MGFTSAYSEPDLNIRVGQLNPPSKYPTTLVAVTNPDKFWLKQSNLTGTDGANVAWTDTVASVAGSAITANFPKLATAFGVRWAKFLRSNSEGMAFANASLTVLNAALTAAEFTITVLGFGTAVGVANAGSIVDKGKTAGCCWLLTQANIGNASGGRKFGRWDKLVGRSSAQSTGKPFVMSYVRTTVGTIIQERIYVNGKLDYSVAAQAPPSNGASNFCIGGTSAGDYFWDGNIGEVQIHGSALTIDQIRANHVALLTQCGRFYYVDPPTTSSGLKIGWVGDSITDLTFNVTGAVYSLTPTITATYLASRLNTTVTNTVNSVAGTSTTTWLPDIVGGSGNFETADAAFDAAGCQVVVIELGVNDAVVDNSTASAYQGKLQRIAREFVDRGKLVVIMPPTYASSDSANLKTREYLAVAQALENGTSIFCGDSQIWTQFFEQNTALQLTQDGVHPLTGGQQILASFYADAIERAVKTMGWF